MELNPPQKEAIEHFEGPLLVLAGAGSGKTRVVTQRIVRLLERGVPASKILGVTFTNKAAEEMRQRVEKLTQHQVLISTFHSLGARILRESIHVMDYDNGFTIYDEDDSLKLLKGCAEKLGILDLRTKLKKLRGLISNCKNELVEPDEAEQEGLGLSLDKDFAKLYRHYQAALVECNAVDFDDLIYLPVKLFREHPQVLKYYQMRWSFFLVDEYQDTNRCQYEMINYLVAAEGNLCVVGDPDQSIYSWRGARVSNILNFSKDYNGAKVIRLEQNYRSTQTILEAANSVIQHNDNRYEKDLWSSLGEGEKLRAYNAEDGYEEGRFVIDEIQEMHDEGTPLKEMVIFYRTNFQSRVFEDILLRKRIPYVIVGGVSFYQRKEIKDVLAYLRMVHSDSDYVSFARTINLPKRGIGATTLDKLRAASQEHKLPILTTCARILQGEIPFTLRKQARTGLEEYLSLIAELRKLDGLKDLVKNAMERSNYVSVLAADPETLDDRKENLQELLQIAEEWEENREDCNLATFLEELSLKSTLDQNTVGDDRVHLMTAHNSKGLEFDVVFMVGMEEDLFPHANSRGDYAAQEEERRLCYVGMTRARKLLYLTHANSRNLWGSHRHMYPSRFLQEIDPKYVEYVSTGQQGMGWDTDSFVRGELDEGQLVMHEDFGIGTILRSFEGSLGLTYEIHFQNDDSKRFLVAKYANLAPL